MLFIGDVFSATLGVWLGLLVHGFLDLIIRRVLDFKSQDLRVQLLHHTPSLLHQFFASFFDRHIIVPTCLRIIWAYLSSAFVS
jgi:hypothetical protein